VILDTNALSAYADGDRAATQQVSRAGQIAVPVIVVGEYRFGIARSRRKTEYEHWLGKLMMVSKVLGVNEETAIEYARIQVQLKAAGTPIPSNDAWIAALCQQYRFPILSRDRHFDCVEGLQRLEW
jgi:tRNA(fMet)-specific endonuclease VapC